MKKKIRKYLLSKIEYYDITEARIEKAIEKYETLRPFGPGENIFETGQDIDDDTHLVMRLVTQYFYQKMMGSMLIKEDDPNVKENLSSGNIGTAGRVVKTYVGADTNDTHEMGSGRFTKMPRIAVFPADSKKTGVPIVKRCSLVSNCSHHFLPFSTKFSQDSYVLVSYIPNDNYAGISKLSRVVNNISRRFHLQEDLTDKIYEAISDACGTPDVYIGLFNIKHTCELLRGIEEEDSGFTTRRYGGRFKTEPELIDFVESSKK